MNTTKLRSKRKPVIVSAQARRVVARPRTLRVCVMGSDRPVRTIDVVVRNITERVLAVGFGKV
jgi:hypothetical protein